MGAALLVSAGAAVQSSAAGNSAAPAFGVTTTKGNTLILIASGSGTASTLPATPAGWNIGPSVTNLSHSCAAIYWLVATGGDSAPTLAGVAGMLYAGQLVEVAGLDGTTPLDQQGTGGNNAASSPLAVPNSQADTTAREFFVSAVGLRYSAGTVVTKTDTFNNGATAVSAQSSGSTANHYSLSYGITTGNSSATQNSFSWSTAVNAQSVSIAVASFKLHPEPPVYPFEPVPFMPSPSRL